MRLGMEKAGKAPEFSAGNQVPVEIRQKNTIRRLLLRVTGTITATGGTGVGSWHSDAAFRIARSIAVEYGMPGISEAAAINIEGSDLATINALYEPTARTQTFPSAALTAGSSHTFDVVLPIPLYMPFALKHLSERFALDTLSVSNPILRVTWANASELVYGNDATMAYTATPTVELYEETVEGAIAPAGGWWPLLMSTSRYRLTGTVSGENHELPGWREGMEIRSVLVTAANNGASDVGYRTSNSVLTKLGLTVNGVQEYEPTGALVNQGNMQEFYDLAAVRTGVYAIDAAFDKDVAPFALYSIGRGQRPYATFDATYNSGNAQHLLRFLAIGTSRSF